MKIIDLLLHQRMNNKPAISEDNDTCSYAELYEKCVWCASFLKSHVSQRCHVGILLPNSIKYVVAYFSVLMKFIVLKHCLCALFALGAGQLIL